MAQIFPKEERLCSQRLIERLHTEGHRLMAFPFSVRWMPIAAENGSAEGLPWCQVMIVAPKRRFKRAVDRNRIRRLARECYRHRKGVLSDCLAERNLHIALSLVYVHGEILDYRQMGKKMDKMIALLKKDLPPQ